MKRSGFASLFAPYVAHEGDHEMASHTLSFLLRTLFTVTVLIAGISVLAGLHMALLLSSLGAGIMVLLLLLMRRGFSRAASLLLIVTWQTIGIAALVTGDGIHDVAIIIFPAVLVTASLLLNRTLFSAMAVLSVVAIALTGAAEVLGMIETPFSEPGRWGDVAIVAIILACVALLIRFLTEALHLSLDQAHRNEQNFREVFNATHEAIIISDAQTGEILDANDSFLTMTGLSREQAISMPAERFFTKGVSWEQIRQSNTASPEVLEFDFPADEREARRIEVTVRRSTIGGQDCVLAVARDITERRRLEDRLRQSEKMQAVGQLAGGIAHDFNNQLVGIVGCADILRAELAEHPELISFADKILGSARRASDLTAHLLAFARKGKFLAVPVDLHDIINEVVALLERSIDKQIHITLGLGAHPPTTLGDPSQLQSCFLNLALNARDAMPNGGELRFMTSIVHIDEEYCRANPYAIEAGDHVEISVSDTGVGMNQTVIEHIFEPFFTTKEKEKGTGMGLAAVYGTVKNHKGTIGVYSEEGRGTTFRVHLPLLIETEVPRTAEPEAQPIGAPPGAHILLVDDEEMVCETTCTMLRSLGYRVSICRNGQDAVDFIEHSADEIDLVILDMIMPVMGGGATFDALKKVNSGVRVLVSSGYSLEGEAQEILDRGARGFVQKPFLKTKLSRAVREALTVES
jgi:PAS domain S-box-containing protein